MQTKRHVSPLLRWFKPALASLMVAWVVCSAFLSSPALHRALHDDAASSSHQCALTVFEQQHLSASESQIRFQTQVSEYDIAAIPAAPVFIPAAELRQFPSRAPPVSSVL